MINSYKLKKRKHDPILPIHSFEQVGQEPPTALAVQLRANGERDLRDDVFYRDATLHNHISHWDIVRHAVQTTADKSVLHFVTL